MSEIINRIQLPTKCSNCGNKLFRVQYKKFLNPFVHSLDYCPQCDLEMDNKFKSDFELERKLSTVAKYLILLLMALAIIYGANFLIFQITGKKLF